MRIIRIGRSSNNDVVISDPFVGRNHCQIIQDSSGSFRLVDLNAVNGTFVNGVRRQGEVRLNQADIVKIGNTVLPWQSYFTGTGGDTIIGPGPTPYPPPPVGPYPPPVGKGNGFGTTSLVCGLVGLLLFPIILGTLAIIFGGVALNRKERIKGLGVAGLVLGIVDVVIGIIILSVLGSMFLWGW